MKTKWPPRWIFYASIDYITDKMPSLALMKAYLWSTNDYNASWTVSVRKDPARYETGEWQNHKLFLFLSLLSLFLFFS